MISHPFSMTLLSARPPPTLPKIDLFSKISIFAPSFLGEDPCAFNIVAIAHGRLCESHSESTS